MISIFSRYYFAILLSISTIGLFFFRVDLLLLSILFCYVCCPLVELIIHEYWQHRLYQPKNKLISIIVDSIGHLFMPFADRAFLRSSHQFHHKFWKTEHDFTQKSLNNNGWIKHLFMLDQHQDNMLLYKLTDKELQTLLPHEKIIVKYRIYLILAFIVGFSILFGLENLFYFYILPITVFYLYFIAGSEVIPHRPKTIKEERDYPWLLPIIHNLAYHKRHHINPGEIFFGVGRWKYLNLQYYYHKLFFKS